MDIHCLTGYLPEKSRTVVTVGSFDGVHLGHKALLRTCVLEARRRGVESIVVTFLPHPRAVLKPDERTWLLTTPDEKMRLLAESGIDNNVIIPFDESFSRMEPQKFIDRIIVGRLRASAVIVGYDHRFGYNKEGDFDMIGRASSGTDLQRIMVGELTGHGIKISSTKARKAVSDGDMMRASLILGHNYFAMGTAVRDENGTPTLFIPADNNKLMPGQGRYRVLIRQEGVSMAGEMSIKDGKNILFPDGSLYEGVGVEVEFL